VSQLELAKRILQGVVPQGATLFYFKCQGRVYYLMKKENFIKYEVDEKVFFTRKCVDDYNAKTVIVVPDTHSAIIVKDGQMMDTLDSGSHEIFDTKKSFFGLIQKKTENHTVEIIYMSKSYELAVKWGTYDQCVLKDCLTGLNVKVGLRGVFRVVVNNPRQFYLKLIGPRQEYDVEMLKTDLTERVRGNIQDVLAEVIDENKIPIIDIETKEREISKKAFPIMNSIIEEPYGLKMISFDIEGFMFNQEDIKAVKDVLKEREEETKEKRRKEEQKQDERERKEEEKREAKEIAAELERLDDKHFERDILLKELEAKDYEKYLEVLKILASRNSSYLKVGSGDKVNGKTVGSAFCHNCGHSYEEGDQFCPEIGRAHV